MSTGTSNNQRIAKNTVFLYLRTVLMMCVSLYTSRVILATLGIVDYGVNNVVAGVVTMFSFLNSSMNTATQRYLTFSIGKGDTDHTQKVFSLAVRIHIIIGLAVVLICESVGIWMVNHKLVIPPDRLMAANVVFQMTLLSFFINVSQVPYNAAIVAHERMDVYAYISIVDVVLKLIIVYVLTIVPFDKLIVHSILFFMVTQAVRMIYRIFCKKHFPECRWTRHKDPGLFKEMFSFASWNLFGSLAWMLRDQGLNILLNIFFGPAVNAARGVAMQVSHSVKNFVHNFTTSVKPQITKYYAQGKLAEMQTLAYRGSKFSFFLLFMIAFPLMLNIDFVLDLWLKKVPDYASIFIILILIDSLVNAVFGQPMITSLMATGNIRLYQVVVSLVLVGILPVGYVALRMGCSPPSVFAIMIVFSALSGIARFVFCVKQVGYNVNRFLREVLIPVLSVPILSLPLPLLVKSCVHIDHAFLTFLCISAVAFVVESLAIFYIGLSRHERDVVIDMIRKKVLFRVGNLLKR